MKICDGVQLRSHGIIAGFEPSGYEKMPEDGQKVPSGFLVANHGNGLKAVRELQRADLWEAACYSAYPQQTQQG